MKYNDKNTVLNTDAWDYYMFHSIYEKSENFNKSVDSFAKKDSNRFGLIGDVFSSLYKQEPMLKSQMEALLKAAGNPSDDTNNEDLLKTIMREYDIESMNSIATSPNEAIMNKLFENEEYKKMHAQSVGDKLHTSISTMCLGDELLKWFTEQEQKNEKFKKAQNEAKQAQRELEKTLSAIQKRMAEGKEPTNGQLSKEKSNREILANANEVLAKQINKELSNNDVAEMVKKSLEQASDSKENTKNLLGGASDGDAELKTLPIDAQIAIADLLRNNEDVKKIAEMAGRFKEIARKKQKVKHIESIERNGITMGNDISRLLPQELALYSNPLTRNEFLRRFVEGQTMMYSPKGKEILGKGSIVLVLDESGSMSGLANESKGFAIALAMIAKKQKRDLVIIPFSNKVGEIIVCERGKVTSNHIVNLANNFLSGGTQYMPALDAAKKVIETQSTFKNGDIIFVTDGEPQDTGSLNKGLPEFLEFKKQKAVNVFSLLIGNQVTSEHAARFSDKILYASSFLEDGATELFDI